MARRWPMDWAYATMPDPHARLGPDTTLVVRVDGDGYTVLGICPGPAIAARLHDSLVAAPHERLFDGPTFVGPLGLRPTPPA